MYEIRSIKDYHQLAGLASPGHPLISLVDFSQVQYPQDQEEISLVQYNYSIALKRGVSGKLRYGQQPYDFDEGLMSFVAPGQRLQIKTQHANGVQPSGWILLIHPDFFWGNELAKKIKNYDFFGYNINEALFLSEKEEGSMIAILKKIEEEYQANIDAFSQKIILAQVELLLNYAERFYERQFITRKISNHQILNRFEASISAHIDALEMGDKGMPSVEELALDMGISSTYLSSTLRHLTGLNAQQQIHEKLIEKAKEKLTTTQLSVSEIAYSLGFEHAQSFSRLFKKKTKFSPKEFRGLYNN